ncbi:MAG TPA: hypothetical protein VGG68_10300 [Caulobacteraceae bacterium]|jgi:hypothetical protein
MTQFIESVSTHQLLPPYRSENSKVHCFLFDISVGAIQKYCDTFLNLGEPSNRGFHYRPIAEAPFGLLSVTEYPALCSLDQKTAQSFGVKTQEWDHLRQTEFYVAVPVHRYRVTGGNVLVDPVIQWVQPIIITDNATSAFSGREILGLETLYGEIKSPPATKPGGLSFNVSLPSWVVFAPNSPQTMMPFVAINSGPPLAAALAQNAVNSSAIAQLEAAIPDLAGMLEGRFPETLELVILKQFRSAADATQAIYQALIICENRYSNVTDMTVYDPHSVTIDFQNGAMVREIIHTFLDVPTSTGLVVFKPVPGRKVGRSQAPHYTRPLVKMAVSFTATIDSMDIKTQFTFRDLVSA